MSYYVWETRRSNPKQVMAPAFAPTYADHKVNFIAGRRFKQPLPELDIHFHAAGDFAITDDLVIARRRCLVHSARLTDVLRRAGVDGFDLYPCRLVNDHDGRVLRTHHAINLLDVIHCLDRDQSELEVDDEEPNEIWSILRLHLLASRLGDSLMFRLGERRNTVIVHERVVQALVQAGITGPVFLPAEGYREYPGFASDNPRNVIGTHDLDPEGPIDADTEGEEEAP